MAIKKTELNLNLGGLFPDKNLANDGVWFSVNTFIALKIASASHHNLLFKSNSIKNSLKMDSVLKRKIDKREYDYTKDQLVFLEKYNRKNITDSILKDWKGIKHIDGKPFKFSQENADQLLENYPEFVDIINKYALNADNFHLTNHMQIKKK